jgi:PhzF family phenazine biosynthesis protein
MRRFSQVDVFTDTPFGGNPLAVVLDAEGLSTEQMQRFTAWTNLSEAAFVLPPTTAEADYRVRIFTAVRELPFAGHPTLGTCHAWLAAGGRPRAESVVVQECGAGLIPITRDGGRLAFTAPAEAHRGPLPGPLRAHIAGVLGIGEPEILDAGWASNGQSWCMVLLPSARRVLELRPVRAGAEAERAAGYPAQVRPGYIGVAGPHPPGAPAEFEVRAFFPAGAGIAEDPVTGGLNALMATWLRGAGRVPGSGYRVSQGTALGRAGRLWIDFAPDGAARVGGSCVGCVSGVIDFE